jgi:hypothetical protein
VAIDGKVRVNLHDWGKVWSTPQHEGGDGKALARQLTERGHL